MFDFRPNLDQSMLIETIQRFSEEQVSKHFREAEETGTIDKSLLQQGWDIGLLQTSLPEQYGGFGDYSAVTGVLGLEQFAKGDLGITFKMTVPNLFAIPILLCGSDRQKDDFLPRFTDQTAPACTAALIESTYQFNPRDLATTAIKEGDRYRLNGAKVYVPDGDLAEVILVYAAFEGQTEAFLVPRNAEGLTIGPQDRLMGIQALRTFGLHLENVTLPANARLGEAAGIDFDRLLNHSRVACGAAATGMSQAALDYSIDYAKNRVQFGKPVAQNQSLAFMLADMASDVESMRMLVWEAAWMIDQGAGPNEITRAVTVMKRFIDQAVLRIGDGAVQTLGGYGYIREYPVELYLRNARGFPVFDGLTII